MLHYCNMKSSLTFEKKLRDHGFRATPGRVALLTFLSTAKKPLTASEIQNQLPYTIDKVTLYRALEDFVTAKFVTRVHLHNSSTYYELIRDNHHHHHIICEKCGKIEDIKDCAQTSIEGGIAKRSKHFSSIHTHSLEFFGICKKCA